MKANRKYIEGDERAVSAVIGVILMVAITVAIAATVYVYVSGMLGGGATKAPDIAFNKMVDPDRLQVVRADTGLLWSAFNITGAANPGGTVDAGDFVTLGVNQTTIVIRHTATNTLMGTWTWA